MGSCADRPKRRDDYQSPERTHHHHHHHKNPQNPSLGINNTLNQMRQRHHLNTERSQRPMTEEELREMIQELFYKYDTDSDGFLSQKEVRHMLDDMRRHVDEKRKKKNGHHGEDHNREGLRRKTTPQQVRNFFIMADTQPVDNKISKQELYRFYKSKW